MLDIDSNTLFRRPFFLLLGATEALEVPSLFRSGGSLSLAVSASLASLPWELAPGLLDRCCVVSACVSEPFTQHARQNNLPLRPIWQANSLCMGLSPSKASTVGMRRTGSFVAQSQAQIPVFWHFLIDRVCH